MCVCPLTCCTGQGFPSLQQAAERRPSGAVAHFLLRVALHHRAVLVVAVQAAALSAAAGLSADGVAAAVVAERTPTQSGGEAKANVSIIFFVTLKIKTLRFKVGSERVRRPAVVLAEPPAELSVAAHTVVDVPLRLLLPQLLLKLQGVVFLPKRVFLPANHNQVE